MDILKERLKAFSHAVSYIRGPGVGSSLVGAAKQICVASLYAITNAKKKLNVLAMYHRYWTDVCFKGKSVIMQL